MEIDSSSVLFLAPAITTGIPETTQKTSAKNQQQQALQSQQLVRGVTDAEKKAASRQLQDSLSQKRSPNLSQDQPGLRQSQAINAYQEAEQTSQKEYLSQVLGVDLHA